MPGKKQREAKCRAVMDHIVVTVILIVLLLMAVFKNAAVESMINNIEYQSNTNISDRYKLFVEYFYLATLTLLILCFSYGRLFV